MMPGKAGASVAAKRDGGMAFFVRPGKALRPLPKAAQRGWAGDAAMPSAVSLRAGTPVPSGMESLSISGPESYPPPRGTPSIMLQKFFNK